MCIKAEQSGHPDDVFVDRLLLFEHMNGNVADLGYILFANLTNAGSMSRIWSGQMTDGLKLLLKYISE